MAPPEQLNTNLVEVTTQAHVDRTAEIVERRVAHAAASIQLQFTSITQLLEARVNANKEQSDTAISGAVGIAKAERVNLHTLFSERFAALEKARELQALEYERRLTGLNHEHARIQDIQATFVRQDTNTKDWDRLRAETELNWRQLREERHGEAQAVIAAKLVQETSADTSRRTTTLAIISAIIALFSVGVSVLLHYANVAGG